MMMTEQAPSPSDDLTYTIRDGIGWITFNRPTARNALTFTMYASLASICTQVGDDHSVRALVITGAGDKAFAAGTDIAEFRAFKTDDDALAYESKIDALLTLIESCRVPTIAAIAGACTGGGAAIAACCDLRIGTASMRFGIPIARTLGNCLSVANLARLSALLGPARLKEMIFTARLIGAEEAKAVGLLGEILPDHASLMARADELAHLVAGHAPLTLQATKEGLRRLASRTDAGSDADLVLSCYNSADFREGMEAFLAKRPPNWQGV
jgi:enoyl-CoA hydratase